MVLSPAITLCSPSGVSIPLTRSFFRSTRFPGQPVIFNEWLYLTHFQPAFFIKSRLPWSKKHPAVTYQMYSASPLTSIKCGMTRSCERKGTAFIQIKKGEPYNQNPLKKTTLYDFESLETIKQHKYDLKMLKVKDK